MLHVCGSSNRRKGIGLYQYQQDFHPTQMKSLSVATPSGINASGVEAVEAFWQWITVRCHSFGFWTALETVNDYQKLNQFHPWEKTCLYLVFQILQFIFLKSQQCDSLHNFYYSKCNIYLEPRWATDGPVCLITCFPVLPYFPTQFECKVGKTSRWNSWKYYIHKFHCNLQFSKVFFNSFSSATLLLNMNVF